MAVITIGAMCKYHSMNLLKSICIPIVLMLSFLEISSFGKGIFKTLKIPNQQ